MNNKFEVDIIVPIYNCEGEIQRCLNSIEEQTYMNWKCYLLDDGSTDSSGKICDNYSKNDKRFITIHNSNIGVSAERNYGINISTNNYIAFVDGDDYIDKNYIEFLMDHFDDDTDIVMCHTYIRYGHNDIETLKITEKEITFDNSNIKDLIYSSIDESYSINKLNEQFGFINTVWGKIFKRSFIDGNNLRYKNLNYNEDSVFVLEALTKCNKIKIYDNKLYHYCMRDSSKVHAFNPKLKSEYDLYLDSIENVVNSLDSTKYNDASVIFNSLVITSIFYLLKDYYYNPENSEYANKRCINKMILEDKYIKSLKSYSRDNARNAEINFVIMNLIHRRYFCNKIYFSIRPVLKKIYIKLKSMKKN